MWLIILIYVLVFVISLASWWNFSQIHKAREADLEQAERNYAELRSDINLLRACLNISDDNIDLLRSEIADLRAAIDAAAEKKAVESAESEAERLAKKRADEIQRVFDEGLSNILNYGPKTARKAAINGGNDTD